MIRPILLIALLSPLPLSAQGSGRAQPSTDEGVARIPAGNYRPLYAGGDGRVAVGTFELDRHPVTRSEFLEFVGEVPRWRRGSVPPILADGRYLADWPDAPDPRDAAWGRQPLTHVSWFAANAYCEWRGKRLPTMDEWEYVALASETLRDASHDPAFKSRLLELYTRPRTGPMPPVGSGFRNAYGVADMHGLVWEWVLDFHSVMIAEDSRDKGGQDRNLYCASGATGARDASDYAAFLRFVWRASLAGSATAAHLGFRCARSVP